MPLGLVGSQHLLHLPIQLGIQPLEPGGHILVHRGLADAEGAGGEVKESSGESTKAGLGGGVVDEPGKDTEDRGEIGESTGSDSGMSTPMIVLLSVGGLAIIVIVVLLMRRKSQGLPGTKDN